MWEIALYFAAMIAANLTVGVLGPWATPLTAFTLIGLDLALRDRLHDRWRGRQLILKMLALIAGAGLVSYFVGPAADKVAVASLVAFILAGMVDALVYHALIRKGYFTRANGSNAAAALVDSMVFPTIAFGGFLPQIVALQFAAKFAGGFVWSLVLRRRA